MKSINTFLIFFILLIAPSFLFAQHNSEENVKSTMIYSFLRYFQWPPTAENNKRIIGVYGDSEFYELMKSKYHDKDRNGKKIVIKNIRNVEEAASCHIVYLGKLASRKFHEVNTVTQDRPVLLVTNFQGLGRLGSCINFMLRESKVKFELNKDVIHHKNLMVSSTLTRLAVMI